MTLAHHTSKTQQGAALITSLVLLTIMTILAVAAMNTNTLEEKMASNTQEANRAFQASESGLFVAKNDDDSYSYENQKRDPNNTPFNPDDDDYTDAHEVLIQDIGKTFNSGVDVYEADARYRSVVRDKTGTMRSGDAEMMWGQDQALYRLELISTANTQRGANGEPALVREVVGGVYQAGAK